MSAGGPTSFTFEYDQLDQLTYAAGSYSSSSEARDFTQVMTYDGIGNITSYFMQAEVNGATDGHLKRNDSYKYTTRPHAPSIIGWRDISYDADGNQTGWFDNFNNETRTLEWDLEDHLRSATTSTATVDFRYDSDGNRTHKSSYSGTDVSMYFNQFVSRRNNSIETSNVFAGDQRIVSIVDDPDAKDTRRYFYHSDHLQSAQYITDNDGMVYEHTEYVPFGETWVEETIGSEATPNFRFTGKELDPETGLYYFGARYYDPHSALWANADPALSLYVDNSGTHGVFLPLNLNVYSYAWNSPLRIRDPDGRLTTAEAEALELALGELGEGLVVAGTSSASAGMRTARVNGGAGLVIGLAWGVWSAYEFGQAILQDPGRRDAPDARAWRVDPRLGPKTPNGPTAPAAPTPVPTATADAPPGAGVGPGGGGGGEPPRFTVRRFMSRDEYRTLVRSGIVFDPQRGNGIPTTTRNFTPQSQDHARRMTGAPSAEYQVDLNVTGLPRGPTTVTRRGLPEYPIRATITPDRILGAVRVPR